MEQKKERDKHYSVFAQRLEDDIQEWLKDENTKYKSWNLFFRELKQRYGNTRNKKH